MSDLSRCCLVHAHLFLAQVAAIAPCSSDRGKTERDGALSRTWMHGRRDHSEGEKKDLAHIELRYLCLLYQCTMSGLCSA